MMNRHATFLFVSSALGLACGDDKTATPADTGLPEEVADTGGDVVFPDTADTTTPDTAPGDGSVTPGGFGAPCQGNVDCLDGYCVEGPEGFVCTKGCDEECPSGYDCRGVQSGSADTVFLCLPRVAKVCVPCKADYQCTGGACLQIGGVGECATTCEADDDCPDAYVCGADAGGTHEGKFCLPRSGSCDCTPDFAGAVRTCINTNDQGTCYGVETCDPEQGWQGCTAATAVAEVCDGRDNDCNALVDDGIENNVACENRTEGVGVCEGVRVCVGIQGYVCTAQVPSPEVCDFIDNDCDGQTDNVPGRGEACENVDPTGTYRCPGVNVCQEGRLVCLGKTPSAEVCNYEDDDCDGQTDNGFPGLYQTCSVGTGVCERFGTVLCAEDGKSAACNAVEGASSPERCDGLDNDCDGQTDEDYPEVGEVCSDGVGVCEGFGTRGCNADGTGTVCTAVAKAAGAEACDLLDNNCDGATDEPFKNAAGKYSTDKTCGNCFTDCTVIFDKPNASGSCDAAPASPICKMSCDSGFYDLNGVPDDGCEFKLEGDAIYVSESDAQAVDNTSCGAGPTATGGGRKPCKTITYALNRAAVAGSGKIKLLVAGGAYNENINLRDGISIYGGYNPVNWVRDTDSNLTALFGIAPVGHRKTVTADAINVKDTTLDGFAIYGQVANGTAENSYAVWIRNSNGKLHITNNTIWPGTGGPGSNGSRGNDGANGGDGNPGLVAKQTTNADCFAECSGSNPGGTGGTNAACGAGTAGGAGGTAICPDWNESNDLCGASPSDVFNQTSNPKGGVGSGTGGGASGAGGCDNLTDAVLTSCSCWVAETTDACPKGSFAAEGGNGANATPGTGGTASGSNVGQVQGDEWKGMAGGNGLLGGNGAGGGGGGAGGGVESDSAGCSGSSYSDFGGSGGGGGAGGCGGGGGTGAGAGGGAFGIFYIESVGFGANLPVIVDNHIHLGFGGIGGRGGDGGTAGNGGYGGLGGPAHPDGTNGTVWCARPGSKGGEGGDGGPGGGGAGGAGGVAYGLYTASASLGAWKNSNLYYNDGAGGYGGAGGGTGAGGNAGQQGLAGAAATTNF